MKTVSMHPIIILVLVFSTIHASVQDKSPIYLGLGHSSEITDMDINPDENYVITGSTDQTVKLWNIQAGRLIRTYSGHTEDVVSVSLSPNMQVAASASRDKTVKLWDLKTGEILFNWEHPHRVKGARIIQHGYAVLTLDGNLTIRKYEVRSGNLVEERHLSDPDEGKSRQRIREIDEKLNVAYLDTKLRSNLEYERQLLEMNTTPAGADRDALAALSADGSTVLCIYIDGTVRVWHSQSGNIKSVFRLYDIDILPKTPGTNNFEFWHLDTDIEEIRNDGHYAAFKLDRMKIEPHKDIILEIWDIENGVRVQQVKPGNGWINFSTVFMPEKNRVWVYWDLFDEDNPTSDQRQFELYDLEEKKQLTTWPWQDAERTFSFGKGCFLNDQNRMISCVSSSDLVVWNVADTRIHSTFGSGTPSMHKLWLIRDGALAVTENYGNYFFWDMETGQLIKTLGWNDFAFDISPDGTTAVKVFKDSIEVIHPLLNEKYRSFQLPTFSHKHFYSEKAVISPDKRSLLTYIRFADNPDYVLEWLAEYLILWDLEKAKELWRISDIHLDDADFSPDGKYILLSTSYENKDNQFGEDKTWILETQSGTPQFALSENAYAHPHFISDNDIISYLYEEKSFVIWDISTGAIQKKYPIEEVRGLFAYFKFDILDQETKRLLAIPDDNDIYIIDMESGDLIHHLKGHTTSVTSVHFIRQGNILLTGSSDSDLRTWDVKSGKELTRTVLIEEAEWDIFNPEWVTITPQGYFTASKNGAKHLFVSKDLNVFSIDQFFEEFFRPDLVAEAISGKEIQVDRDLTSGFATPPRVEIVSPGPGQSFSQDVIDVVVRAEDTGGGVDEIRLYHNGKAVGDGAARGVAITSQNERTFRVALLEGENVLRAVAFSSDRTESNPYELIVQLEAAAREVSMHLLAVGLNAYRNPALNLNFAVPDASAVVGFFRGEGQELFKNVHVTELYDDAASGEAVRSALKSLESSNPQDVVLIYLAGHGESVGHSWYFLPFEVTYPEREEEVREKGISSEEIAEYIKGMNARKVLLVMDACKAGTALLAFRGFSDRRALLQLARATGVHVIAASSKDQFATEVDELGHGIFTHALLQGLGGQASPEGEPVTVRGLLGWVESQLPILSEKYRQQPQFPVADSRGMDFPLVVK